jgi:hypothetical protein
VDADGKDTNEPIVFSEWAFVTGFNLQRSDYTLDKLLEGDEAGRDLFGNEKKNNIQEPAQRSLFDNSQVENPPSEGEMPDDEGRFLGKTISHYRWVQHHG